MRWMVSSPLGVTDTSATAAVNDPKPVFWAMPRNTPFGSGVPQPARSAAAFMTASCFGFLVISERRNSSGSWPAACATSSMKHSMYKAF